MREYSKTSKLRKNLTYVDISLLGIGVMVGAGIFIMTGIGSAKYAGPGMSVSFIISGAICILVSFAYAELSSMMPVSGSAYSFSYAIFGEIIAWIAGWALILEYFLAGALEANGWSSYVSATLKALGVYIPSKFATPILNGGFMDIPGAIILSIITFMLYIGTKESARISAYLIFVKIAAIIVFLILAFSHIRLQNLQPFMPYGIKGIFAGASIAFFTYIGFDMLSHMSEECVNPSKDLTIGMMVSIVCVMVLYVLVTLSLCGIVKYNLLNTSAPVVFALNSIGFNIGGALVGTGVIFGLTTAILVSLYAQGRLILAMSRDGLIPKSFCKIHKKHHTPHIIILGTGVLVIVSESIFPLNILAELINIGTLFAFILVLSGTVSLRINKSTIKRPYRCSKYIVAIMPAGILCCLYLISILAKITIIFFFFWSIIGLLIYLLYGYWNSVNRKGEG